MILYLGQVDRLVGRDTLIVTQTPALHIINLYSIHLWVPETSHISSTLPTVNGEGSKQGARGREGSRERG